MLQRFKESGWALLKALDILACTIWLGALYPFGLADKPSGRMMISSYVGEAEANGRRWGIIAASAIDALFGKGHCLGAYLAYKGLDQ